jgi:hypothetical protein
MPLSAEIPAPVRATTRTRSAVNASTSRFEITIVDINDQDNDFRALSQAASGYAGRLRLGGTSRTLLDESQT